MKNRLKNRLKTMTVFLIVCTSLYVGCVWSYHVLLHYTMSEIEPRQSALLPIDIIHLRKAWIIESRRGRERFLSLRSDK
jgi:hypothetical protein